MHSPSDPDYEGPVLPSPPPPPPFVPQFPAHFGYARDRSMIAPPPPPPPPPPPTVGIPKRGPYTVRDKLYKFCQTGLCGHSINLLILFINFRNIVPCRDYEVEIVTPLL